MSASLTSTSGPFAATRPAVRFGAAITAGFVALLRTWRRRRDLASINELGPRELSDIGIGPGGQEGAIRYGRRWAERHRGDAGTRCPSNFAPPPSSGTEWR